MILMEQIKNQIRKKIKEKLFFKKTGPYAIKCGAFDVNGLDFIGFIKSPDDLTGYKIILDRDEIPDVSKIADELFACNYNHVITSSDIAFYVMRDCKLPSNVGMMIYDPDQDTLVTNKAAKFKDIGLEAQYKITKAILHKIYMDDQKLKMFIDKNVIVKWTCERLPNPDERVLLRWVDEYGDKHIDFACVEILEKDAKRWSVGSKNSFDDVIQPIAWLDVPMPFNDDKISRRLRL